MKRLIPVLMVVVFTVMLVAGGKKYGKELTVKEETKVSAIMANPDAFVGKTVLVKGKVLDVCSHMGCWMEIEGDNENEMIKVKVKDGEIVFPVEAKGKTAMVEGEVYKLELTHEEAVDYYEHFAEEQGLPFDSASVTGPVTLYQIKGAGAEIED